MRLGNISYKKALGWLFISISLVMLANSVRLCFSKDIWYDELFTVGMIEHSYGELIHFTAKDVHPPLYYCITKAIVDLCKLIIPSADTIIAAKIASVVPYFLILIYAVTFLRHKFGIFTAGVFTFCIVSMPQMSAYTVEMRMYGWALFFVTAAFFHAYEIMKRENCPLPHYAAFTAYGLAAAYTQYFACVAVIMIYVFLLIWFIIRYWVQKKTAAEEKTMDSMAAAVLSVSVKRWALCVIVSIIGYLPWLFVLFSQIKTVRANYWILPLTWRNLGGCVKFSMKPAFYSRALSTALAVILFLLYLSLFAERVYQIYKEYREYEAYKAKAHQIHQQADDFGGFLERAADSFYAAAGCLVLCGLVWLGFFASAIIRPIFVYRYMIPAMGCFWLCFVLNIDALTGKESAGRQNDKRQNDERRKVSRYQKMTFVVSLILLLLVGLRDYRAFMGEEEYKIVLMKETEQAFFNIAKEDIIVYNFDQMQAVAGYYLPQENYLWRGEPEQLIEEMFGSKAAVENTAQIEEWLAAGKKVWFFGSFNSREDICAQWEADGLTVKECGSYMLERYWFNIYEVSE